MPSCCPACVGARAATTFASLVASPQTFDTLRELTNPDPKYADHDVQRYASATVTPGQFVAIFKKVKTLDVGGSAPQTPLAKRTRAVQRLSVHTAST
ncbi:MULTISPECIES: hypothetical protein [unclassified Caballeronia]|uniref:hypothetical protein n=1 Tax=unclassified Caballeronia TaxID=2646786 RepID=UPI0028620D4F|nr:MULTISPECIES: hypothetical protein [unclassified Caballeronia]MDR5750538.1 hypothetical protein [Caballeronia sp. LZ024]MDR5842429.1 hypothetical protein [Caballeronia sp. LZ031]